MLNEKNERELAYVVKVDNILPIIGADRVELAQVGGWRVMVGKGQFQPGDLAIYFEIDSKTPEEEPFMFLAPKHFKVKTQKYFKGTVISQGLLMSLIDFPDMFHFSDSKVWVYTENQQEVKEKDFLTKALNITYAVDEDNARKANSIDKYKKMAQRKPYIFRQKWAKWMMNREWGKKVMFFVFGKAKDKKSGWPAWVSKTDEERVQNMPWILEDKSFWIATEKIDGTSTTFSYKRGKTPKRDKFFICSRNVVFDNPNKERFHNTNVYTEMAEQYNIKEVLKDLCYKNNLKWVTLQGETYGGGIRKRDYGLKEEHCFVGFNLIFSDRGRLNSIESKNLLLEYAIPWVPIVDEKFILPDTVEELLEIATDKSQIDGGMREGLVFRSLDGTKSFKAVSNEFLMKYHG